MYSSNSSNICSKMATVKEKIRSFDGNKRFVSFEFFPPKTDAGFRNLLARLNRMSALNPLFTTITWGAGGSTSEKSLELAETCQEHLNLTTVLHLTCTNTNKEIIDNALARAKKSGIRNILALRGDPPRTEEYWTPNCEFSAAIDLVKYIKANYGDYFCIGVAGYPEGHVDGSDNSNQSPEKDLPYLIEKVEAGADFIVTQLFYDADKFVAYEKLIRSHEKLKDIILIPGLMPISTYEVFKRATKLSHASIPEFMSRELDSLRSNDDLVKEKGVELLVDLISEIDSKTNGRIKGYHFYCLNLEKAVASIMSQSSVLGSVMDSSGSSLDSTNDSAIADDSDSELSIVPNKTKRRASSMLNENGLATPTSAILGGTTAAQRSIVGKSLLGDKKLLVDISTGKGALGKDATWDDFPNGRFGDSNSPAYGQIDGYGPTLKVSSSQEAIKIWGEPETTKDIAKVFVNYLTNKIEQLPWVDVALSSETALIQEELLDLNEKGWFSLSSQPAVDGCKSTDKIFGWGPNNGVIYQKAFVELFLPKKDWEENLFPKIKHLTDESVITYFVGNSEGEISSNLPIDSDSSNTKNAITWGVFPSKEVLQPTIIDFESFKAWNEEAFHLWLEWARCYKKNSKSYNLLNNVFKEYYLVSLIHHDFKNEYGLWNSLLQ